MILDIIIILIVAGLGFYGYKKGFIFSLVQTVGWVLALALAYLLTPRIISLFKDHTGFFQSLSSVVEGKIDVSLNKIEIITNSLPSGMQPTIDTYTNDLVEGVSEGFANVFGVIILFFAMFVAVKLALWIAQRLLSRDYSGGVINAVDGILGALLGVARAAIVICLLLVILAPLTTLISTGFTSFFNDQLEQSFITEAIYKNNPVIMLIQGYLNF
jgi:uncharacterized membrane protein required for colicin V production